MDDLPPPFFIGHHDVRRPLPVTSASVRDTHAANYDMLTSPITTPHFHSRVLSLLSSSLADGSISSHVDLTRTRNGSPIVVSPLSPADTPLTPDDSISQIIGVTSTWTDLSSPDPIIADVSHQVLKLELTYAAFCGITHLLIPSPNLKNRGQDDSGLAQYARAILDALSQAPYMQLYLCMPMIDHSDDDKEEMGDLRPFARQQFMSEGAQSKRLDLFGTWEAWNMIRSICRYPSRLSVALSLPRLLPPVPIQSRWYSEPVRIVILESEIFSKNAKGYPVLSKAHQALVTRFIRSRNAPWFLLCNVGPIPSSTSDMNGVSANDAMIMDSSNFPTPAEVSEGIHIKDPTPHLSYMRNLQTKQPALTPLDRFGAGYQDYLQAPLQPLTVNLESITYEVFEKDPIKYDWYERAIARALHDWIEQGKPTSNPDGRIVVAVVGAGRGPLVTRALKASEDVGVEIDMWALEKNPNAFVLLQRHNELTWDRKVSLVKSDMRTWRGPLRHANAKHISRVYNREAEFEHESQPLQASLAPAAKTTATTFTGSPDTDTTYLLATATHQATSYKIDILISELLGSFADNELSPECLDGVQHLLNPIHGISIPASYTAHLTPIAAPKLHADIIHTMPNGTGSAANAHAAEIPYVVMFNAIDFLSTTTPAPGDPNHAVPTSPQSPGTKAHTSMLPAPPVPYILPAWSFSHPNPSLPTLAASSSSSHHLPQNTASMTAAPSSTEPLTNSHNARHCTLTFAVPNRGVCHGLAGYFETVLYGGVELSTNPETMDRKSGGMISWFPIYFPLKTPLYVPDSSSLTVNMWRKTDDRRVWYEWMVDAYISDPSTSLAAPRGAGKGKEAEGANEGKNLVNRRGRRVRVAGSELHSSEKEACLM